MTSPAATSTALADLAAETAETTPSRTRSADRLAKDPWLCPPRPMDLDRESDRLPRVQLTLPLTRPQFSLGV
ncbi:hypothetical protein LINGRAHAP2_LOCUS31523 [Linum grandiflorum]